jgi:hypothetical protein
LRIPVLPSWPGVDYTSHRTASLGAVSLISPSRTTAAAQEGPTLVGQGKEGPEVPHFKQFLKQLSAFLFPSHGLHTWQRSWTVSTVSDWKFRTRPIPGCSGNVKMRVEIPATMAEAKAGFALA